MLLSLLALTVATTAPAAPHAASDSPVLQASRAAAASVVFLDCQVGPSALSDCKVVNDDPVDPAAAETAVKLAQAMTVPPALAQRGPGRIVVKLNVTP